MEQCKSSVRVKVEQVFSYVKQIFDESKTRQGGLGKTENRLSLVLGFANVVRSQCCRV